MQLRTPHEIGLLVREQRKSKSWTQEQLAKRLGLSRLFIVQLEQGKETVQLGLVMRTLNELGVPMQVNLSLRGPVGPSQPPDAIDLDNIIREAATPYRS